MTDKKTRSVITPENLRDEGGAKWVQNVNHQRGNTRGEWEDRLSDRIEKAGYIAGLIAKKFASEGIITINEDGKSFHIAGENGGEVYGIKMLPLVWAALKKKK